MLDKLDAIKARFEQVGVALTNPEIINDQKQFGAYSKEYRSLEKIVKPYDEYQKVMADYTFAKDNQNSSDPDMRELAKMELPELEEKKEALEKELTKLLIPKDPQDDKNAILEIREEKVIGLEEAIRRMTSLPATKFRLKDRGLLLEGMAADIVIFDEKMVIDRSTFDQPHQYSSGFSYVLVNGQLTVNEGQHTGMRAGKALRKSIE